LILVSEQSKIPIRDIIVVGAASADDDYDDVSHSLWKGATQCRGNAPHSQFEFLGLNL